MSVRSIPLFVTSDFFDARDLVQVKYEMVRRVQVDYQPVSSSATAFGFSRPSFYQAQARLESGGLAALVPQKPGPRRRHKLDAEVMTFLQKLRSEDPSLKPPDLVDHILERFGRRVHVRSVERALARQEKNYRDHPQCSGRRCGGGLRRAAPSHAGGFAGRPTFRHGRAFKRGDRRLDRAPRHLSGTGGAIGDSAGAKAGAIGRA